MTDEYIKKGEKLYREKYASRKPDLDEHSSTGRSLTFIDSVKEKEDKVVTKSTYFFFKYRRGAPPGELVGWQQSTKTLDRYFAIGGHAGGKALTSAEIPSGYSMYNRNNRWIKGPKAVWISDALLLDPEEIVLNEQEQVVLDYLLTAGYSAHNAKCMIVAGRTVVSPPEGSA